MKTNDIKYKYNYNFYVKFRMQNIIHIFYKCFYLIFYKKKKNSNSNLILASSEFGVKYDKHFLTFLVRFTHHTSSNKLQHNESKYMLAQLETYFFLLNNSVFCVHIVFYI